ncbi:SDR family NAD(P)-dependent oxidoreductase [Glaciibacter flavus]|uniref:SDR family NAD(P)-dependent oxidoreductase n=1 Tax=Orlajensenia flava TaxID=2565934 RepID=A0A4S4FVX5_9MICO|nr:SDR family NAD(P)-dependent oxidoreductase [Glaciibacter flavus]THG34035.1 SDR family NAD(P)-dependent oxidoreductase [Glaciibacter flavus]
MDVERMDGRTVAVFGGSSGVGLAVAKGMARLGARTIVISRSVTNGQRAVDTIHTHGRGSGLVESIVGDPSTRTGAELLATALTERTDRLDALVSTAGSIGETGRTAAGVPRVFATNYLVHFQLLRSVLPMLDRTPGSRALMVGVAPALVKRIRNVRLDGVDPNASAAALMTQAVAWKLLLARHLADIRPEGPTVNVFHPGLIRSNLLATQSLPLRLVGSISNMFAKERCTVVEHLASSRSLAGISGRMVDDHGREVALPAIVTAENATAVWTTSERMAR